MAIVYKPLLLSLLAAEDTQYKASMDDKELGSRECICRLEFITERVLCLKI